MSIAGAIWIVRDLAVSPRLYNSPQVALVAYIDHLKAGDLVFIINALWVEKVFWYYVLCKKGQCWMTSQDVSAWCREFLPNDEAIDDVSE